MDLSKLNIPENHEFFRPKKKEEEPPVKQWTVENTWTVIILVIISLLSGFTIVIG